MDDDPMRLAWSILPILCAIALVVAVIMLWRKHRSMWLIVAMIGLAIEIVMHIVDFLLPGLSQVLPMIYLVWQLVAVLFAVGLLGYAIETTKRR